MKKCEYYFDFLSPYSYLSWQWVKRAKKQDIIEFEFIPSLLGKVIHHYETKGPAEIVPKRNYLFKDCLRFAANNNIEFVVPTILPFNSLYALRIALSQNSKDQQFAIIDTIFDAAWSRGINVGDPQVLQSVLSGANFDGEHLLKLAMEKHSRALLKENVKRALDSGVFGFPTFIVEGELFWGNDSIPHLLKFVENKDPLSIEKYQQFIKQAFK
ncbi:MAG: 2-hydroxychromene-2-carboxylate isomerase [Bacteriovoracaceae bacterium]|nr:2-hydroxychromene-2-carboxylate isomerase [Bacteriovoracaceae bacterium]